MERRGGETSDMAAADETVVIGAPGGAHQLFFHVGGDLSLCREDVIQKHVWNASTYIVEHI